MDGLLSLTERIWDTGPPDFSHNQDTINGRVSHIVPSPVKRD